MLKTDILVIGGSAAGLVSAMTSKSNFPNKDVMMIRKEEKVMIPCGIPYIFGSLGTSDNNILPDAGLNQLGVNIKIGEVTEIDKEEKICVTSNGEKISYEKLIITTGSKPYYPNWLEGVEKDNVYVIPKDKKYLDGLMDKLQGLEKIVVVGAGFIGVETSDELNKNGKKVILVEKEEKILGMAFDDEVSAHAKEKLETRGVKVIVGAGITKIIGDDVVSSVQLDNGEIIEAQAVILSMGYRPNSNLAKESGLKINDMGFIVVDEYMRSSVNDIFAAGDCASKKDFATGRISSTMLASTACAEARVAGLNLYGLSTFRSFKGTIGIYSTNIGETSYGVAGLTEKNAIKEGFDIIVGSFKGVDRHPGKLAGASEQRVKLVVAKESGVIIGGEIIGGDSVGELINVIGFIIQAGFTLNDLLVSQIGTQPMLTASPAAYPLIKAAENVLKLKRQG